MKVSRNTPHQLIVEDVPWLLGIMLAGFILLFVGVGIGLVLSGEIFGLLFAIGGGGVGGLCFALMVRRVQVILDRPTGTLVIRRRSVLGYSEVRHDLADLSGAILEETRSSKGSTLRRPTLVLDRGMSQGRHPVVATYTNTGGPRKLVQAVNQWLQAHGPRATVDSGAASD